MAFHALETSGAKAWACVREDGDRVCVYRGLPDGNGDQQEGKFDVNTQNVCRASGGNWREQGHRGNSSKAVVRSLWRRSERKKEHCGRGKEYSLGRV